MVDTNEADQIDQEQRLRLASDRSLRLRLARSNWGIQYGWFVEWQQRQVATLTEPRRVDMFWVSYRVTPLTDEPSVRASLATADFWRTQGVRFRNRELGLVAPLAFGAGDGPSDGRVAMRGLYVRPPLTYCDHFVLFFERMFRERRTT